MNNNNYEIRINPLVKVIRTGENSLLLKSVNNRRFLNSEKQIEFIELILSNINEWTKSDDLMMKFLDRERAIFENILVKLESQNFIQYRKPEEVSDDYVDEQFTGHQISYDTEDNDLYKGLKNKRLGILYEGNLGNVLEEKLKTIGIYRVVKKELKQEASLETNYKVIDEILKEKLDLVVLFTYNKRSSVDEYMKQKALFNSKSWLRAYMKDFEACIGPLFIPGSAPCPSCHVNGSSKWEALKEADSCCEKDDKIYPELYYHHIANVISLELYNHFSKAFQCNLINNEVMINMTNQKSKYNSVEVLPHCTVCSEVYPQG